MSDSDVARLAAESADDQWSMVLERYPDATRPEVSVVRFVEPQEQPQVLVDCMGEEGFVGKVEPDGGATFEEMPTSQLEAWAVANYICQVKYPQHPKYTQPLNDAQLDYLYDYDVNVLIPCLESEGHAIGDPPTHQRFVEEYASTGWTPWRDVGSMSPDAYNALVVKCPQKPDGLWG